MANININLKVDKNFSTTFKKITEKYGEDFEYFKRNNKIINVDVDVAFAETGFLIGKKLGDKEK